MERISLDELIETVKGGGVARKKYIENVTNDILYMSLHALIRRAERGGAGRELRNSLNRILDILQMAYTDDLCYMDIVCLAGICLLSEYDEMRENVYQIAEPLVKIFNVIQKTRAKQ